MKPEEERSVLCGFLYEADRVHRFYHSAIIHAPAAENYPGWGPLCDLADRATAQAQSMLDSKRTVGSCDAEIPVPSPGLFERIKSKRAGESVPARRPGSRLH